ncbi:acyltransferase family protein [Flindersiella endophytica]
MTTTGTRTHQPGRYAALDGLRAVGALTVLAYHLYPQAIPGGSIGVDVFFGISGFVITQLLLREHDRTGTITLRPFYVRRFRRLLPPLLLVAGFVVVWDGQWLAALLALTYMVNLVRAAQPGTYSDLTGSLGHTWSLAIEEQFYLLWPVALRFLLSRLTARALIAITAGLCLLPTAIRLLLWDEQAAHRIYNGFDTRADQLLLGCLLALLLHRASPAVAAGLTRWGCRLSAPAAAALLAFAVFVPVTGRTPSTPFVYTWGFLVAGLLTTTLLAGLVTGARWGSVLAWPPLAWIGRRLSYGIYLWHYPLLALAGSFDLTGLPRTITVVLTTLAAAALTYVLVERPMAGRKMPRRSAARNLVSSR